MTTLQRYAVTTALAAVVTLSAGAVERKETKQQPAAGSSEEITGTVEEIDHSKGTLALNSRSGTLRLHFPPPSIGEIKKGDTITAWLAIAKAAAAKESTRAF